MRLGFMCHVHDDRHENKPDAGEKGKAPSPHNPPNDRVNRHHTHKSPKHAPKPRDNIKPAERFGMIQIPGDIGAQINQVENSRRFQQRPNRINPQAAILIELGIKIPLPRLHLGKRLERVPFVRLIRHQPISPDDPRPIGVVPIDDNRHASIHGGMAGHIRPAIGIIRRPGQRKNLPARPDLVIAKEESIDAPRRQSPVYARQKHAEAERQQNWNSKSCAVCHGGNVSAVAQAIDVRPL